MCYINYQKKLITDIFNKLNIKSTFQNLSLFDELLINIDVQSVSNNQSTIKSLIKTSKFIHQVFSFSIYSLTSDQQIDDSTVRVLFDYNDIDNIKDLIHLYDTIYKRQEEIHEA